MNKLFNIILILSFAFALGFSCNYSENELGNGFKLVRNGGRATLTKVKDNKIVYSIGNRIVDIDYNDNYILIYRIVDDGDVRREGVYEFYIIDKKMDKFNGPLSFDEYIYLREELKIDLNLKLEIEV